MTHHIAIIETEHIEISKFVTLPAWESLEVDTGYTEEEVRNLVLDNATWYELEQLYLNSNDSYVRAALEMWAVPTINM